jgi:hypothetical protein
MLSSKNPLQKPLLVFQNGWFHLGYAVGNNSYISLCLPNWLCNYDFGAYSLASETHAGPKTSVYTKRPWRNSPTNTAPQKQGVQLRPLCSPLLFTSKLLLNLRFLLEHFLISNARLSRETWGRTTKKFLIDTIYCSIQFNFRYVSAIRLEITRQPLEKLRETSTSRWIEQNTF